MILGREQWALVRGGGSVSRIALGESLTLDAMLYLSRPVVLMSCTDHSASSSVVKKTYPDANSESELSDSTQSHLQLLSLLCSSRTLPQNQIYSPFKTRLTAPPPFRKMDSPQYTKSALPSLLNDSAKREHSGVLRTIQYHAQTLWLFTCDQVLDTVVPGTAFGVLGAMSGPVLDLPSQSPLAILKRLPLAFFWLWLMILEFCVQNQRSPGSIEEDSINKPWRPIPTKRITPAQAQRLLDVVHVTTATVSYCLDVLPIFGVYLCLITLYNDFGGGNKSGVLRNLFCGGGFSCYFGGAMTIAVGPHAAMGIPAWSWTLLITCGVLMTTIQAQEFRDEVGDKARGRRTLVTEYGRSSMLWLLLVIVFSWTLYLPLIHFKGDWTVAAFPIAIGGSFIATILQSIHQNSTALDRRMYKFWCIWMFAFCPLPVLKGIMA
jgi:hypothetical protein